MCYRTKYTPPFLSSQIFSRSKMQWNKRNIPRNILTIEVSEWEKWIETNLCYSKETILGIYKFMNQLLSFMQYSYSDIWYFFKNQPDTFFKLFANFHDKNYNKRREKLPWIFWQRLMSKMKTKLYALTSSLTNSLCFNIRHVLISERKLLFHKNQPPCDKVELVLYLFKIKTAIKAEKNTLEYFDNRAQLMSQTDWGRIVQLRKDPSRYIP